MTTTIPLGFAERARRALAAHRAALPPPPPSRRANAIMPPPAWLVADVLTAVRAAGVVAQADLTERWTDRFRAGRDGAVHRALDRLEAAGVVRRVSHRCGCGASRVLIVAVPPRSKED